MSDEPSAIHVIPYADEDAEAVFALVARIQDEEHGGADSEAEAADLRSIPETYIGGASGFWVAKRDGRVVGTAALSDLGNGVAMLKRMYVAKAFRGSAFGTAQALLRQAVSLAQRNGVAHIVLGTMAEPVAAPRFYEKSGFDRIDRGDMTIDAPISEMDTHFYRRSL